MCKSILKPSLVVLGVALSVNAFAQTKLPITENGKTQFSISKTQYNRISVENDAIATIRLPQNHLALEYAKDGSVYADALDDRDVTIFVETKKGYHFSANVSVKELDGQTIIFSESIKKVVAPQIKKTKGEQLVALMKATQKEELLAGFDKDVNRGQNIRLQPNINLSQVYSLSNNKVISQKFTLKNIGNKPVTINKSWITDKNTASILMSTSLVYPHQEISVVRVEEKSNAKV